MSDDNEVVLRKALKEDDEVTYDNLSLYISNQRLNALRLEKASEFDLNTGNIAMGLREAVEAAAIYQSIQDMLSDKEVLP